MGINKLISSKNAVMQAKEEVGLEGTTRYDALFKLWVRQCDDAIGTSDLTLKHCICKVTVDGCRGELPCDAVAIYPAVFQDEICCDDCMEFISTLDRMFYSNGGRLISRDYWTHFYGGTGYRFLVNEFTVRDNKIIFNTNAFDGRDIWVVVMSRQKDDDGYIMIHPEYLRACIEYCRVKYAKRAQFTGSPYKFQGHEIRQMEREYHRLVSLARGDVGDLTPAGEERLKNLINSPFSGTAHFGWMINYSSGVI